MSLTGCALERELGDDAEVAAAAAQRPEQLGVLVGARGHLAARRPARLRPRAGCRSSGRSPRVRWPIPPPSVSPPTPVVEMTPHGDGEPVLVRRRVDLAPGGSRRRHAPCARRVDRDRVQQRQVDDDAVVDAAEAAAVVAAAADSERNVVLAREARSPSRRRRRRAARDQRRPLVDHRVEQAPGPRRRRRPPDRSVPCEPIRKRLAGSFADSHRAHDPPPSHHSRQDDERDPCDSIPSSPTQRVGRLVSSHPGRNRVRPRRSNMPVTWRRWRNTRDWSVLVLTVIASAIALGQWPSGHPVLPALSFSDAQPEATPPASAIPTSYATARRRASAGPPPPSSARRTRSAGARAPSTRPVQRERSCSAGPGTAAAGTLWRRPRPTARGDSHWWSGSGTEAPCGSGSRPRTGTSRPGR